MSKEGQVEISILGNFSVNYSLPILALQHAEFHTYFHYKMHHKKVINKYILHKENEAIEDSVLLVEKAPKLVLIYSLINLNLGSCCSQQVSLVASSKCFIFQYLEFANFHVCTNHHGYPFIF